VECDSSGWWEASKGCCTCLFCVFSQIEFHFLCLVGVLLQLTFLSGHGAGVLCVLASDLNCPGHLAHIHFAAFTRNAVHPKCFKA